MFQIANKCKTNIKRVVLKNVVNVYLTVTRGHLNNIIIVPEYIFYKSHFIVHCVGLKNVGVASFHFNGNVKLFHSLKMHDLNIYI